MAHIGTRTTESDGQHWVEDQHGNRIAGPFKTEEQALKVSKEASHWSMPQYYSAVRQAKSKRQAGETPSKPKPKPKTRKERVAEIDPKDFKAVLGSVFLAKTPEALRVLAQFPEIPENLREFMAQAAREGPSAGAMMAPGQRAAHQFVRMDPGVTHAFTPIQRFLHEVAGHGPQYIVQAGESEFPWNRAVQTTQQVLESEKGAWSPQVQRGAAGGIKTLQDIGRSPGGLASYLIHRMGVPPAQAMQMAKRMMMIARMEGGVESSIPAIARASKGVITPEIKAAFEAILSSPKTLQEFGPKNLQDLAKVAAPGTAAAATQVLRRLGGLKGILPMLSPEILDEIFRKVMPFANEQG